ncbi:MAG TPA: tRNA pseudouridine(38-40) synthase TruA [Candidatus Polarisedimenticolaceae bacterium]|nr:tRNA pseudouridine(38-40) synthase TruA [Candidatus Polarisedimenticolaceae bacterium]
MTLRRIRLELSYDGTDFAGWQWQDGRRTVQGVVEQALRRLAGDRVVRLRAAGRTDAGVHARAQVADCLIDSRLDDDTLARALGRMLPPDVRPRSVATVDRGFSAMRQAVRKTYRYRVDRSRFGNPLIARFALHCPDPLDAQRIERTLAMLVGRRDWSGFADSRCRVENRVRDLTEATFREHDGDEASFHFTADGFLTYMVRNMVGTVLEIGRGRMPVEVIGRMLASRDRRLGAATAPARGLCLWEVVYARRPAIPAERGGTSDE